MDLNLNHIKIIGLICLAFFASLLINANGVIDTYYTIIGRVVKEFVIMSPDDKIKVPVGEQCKENTPKECQLYRFERTDKKKFMVTQYGSYTCYYSCPKETEAPEAKDAEFESL